MTGGKPIAGLRPTIAAPRKTRSAQVAPDAILRYAHAMGSRPPPGLSEPDPVRAALGIAEERDPAALADAFTAALRHLRAPSPEPPPALRWAEEPSNKRELLQRINAHPVLVERGLVASEFNDEVVFTDVTTTKPQLAAERERNIGSVRAAEPAEREALGKDYAVARSAGRFSSWPEIVRAWDAADSRGDVRAQRLAAFAALALETMQRARQRPSAPPPRSGGALTPTLLDVRTELAKRLQAGELKPLVNRDQHAIQAELADARRQRFSRVPPTDRAALRALMERANEDLKWIVTEKGELFFGLASVTHAVVAHPDAVVAAGQASLYERPDGRLSCLSLDNTSGHFRPSPALLPLAAQVFEAHGIDVPRAAVSQHKEQP